MTENSLWERPKQGDLRCYIPKRYTFTLMGVLGICSSYALRYNLSVTMVAMVNHTRTDLPTNESTISEECSENLNFPNSSSGIKEYKGEQYNWDSKEQGYIMSAFFYCYFTTVFTGGFLADRYGAKLMFGGGVFLTALLTLLTPVVLRWGTIPFIILRALEGIGEGVIYPSCNVLVGNWAPKHERSRISSTIFSGSSIGSFLCLTISGWLCTLDFLGGWPAAFYFTGAVSCIWSIFWMFLIYESPEKHPGISKEELSLFLKEDGSLINEKSPTIVQWKKIAFSLPMWSVIITQCGAFFCVVLLLTETPTYLSSVLHFDVSTIGLIVGFSHILEWIGAGMGSFSADKLISSRTLTRTNVRKLFNSLTFFGLCTGFIGLTFSGCNRVAAVAVFAFSSYIQGFRYSGFNVMHMEMCPQLVGSLYGIANGIACIFAMVGPIMTGYLTESGDSLKNWNSVFYVGAAVCFFVGAVFAVFASAEKQPWLTKTEISR